MSSFFADLRDPARLADAAERVLAIRPALRRLAPLVPDLAARLARALGTGEYVPRVARLHWALLDKRRELYELELADLVVHHAFARLLVSRLEPHFSPSLYSYRLGRSANHALAAVVELLRRHRAVRPPRERGLFALRCDVQRYGDSIPMGATSPLWQRVFTVIGDCTSADRELVMGLIRPSVLRAGQGEATPLYGVPTGSPIATAIANLYLMPLDERMRDRLSLYARFGDDLLLIAEDPEPLRDAAADLERWLTDNGLTLNTEKQRWWYWTGAGHAAAVPWARGTTTIDYLGRRISFDATIGLPREKQRRLLKELARRQALCQPRLRELASDAQVEALVAITRAALEPYSVLAAPHVDGVPLLTDRRQLRHLDYLIALRLAERVGKKRGVRAFRRVPYARLRRDCGLPSLLLTRDRRSHGG